MVHTCSFCSGVKNLLLEDGESTLKVGYGYHRDLNYWGLFYSCPIETLYIGRNISAERSDPFGGNDYITNVTIGNYVTSIGDIAFTGCHGLTSISIPNSVTSIGCRAFEGCTSLTSITIPSSVTMIVAQAFWNCDALTSFTCLNPTPPEIVDWALYGRAFDESHYRNVTLYVPKGAVYDYERAREWEKFSAIKAIDATGIESIEMTKQTPTAIFDPCGRKLTEPQKGINVVDGKKVLIK